MKTKNLESKKLVLLLLVLKCVWFVGVYGYKVPGVLVEPLAKGFRVSIPDQSGVQGVAFNVNRNRNFTDFEQGEFSVQVRESVDGRWKHDFLKTDLRAYDTLYIWTNVQYGSAIYRDQGHPQQVCQLAGNHLPAGCTQTHSQLPESTTENGKIINKTVQDTENVSLTCQASETVMSPTAKNPLCKGQLIFEENFEHIDNSRWLHEVRAPLDSMDAEFVLYDGTAHVNKGNLIIEPQLWTSYRPDMPITNAHLDLSERCTGTHNRERECVLLTSGPLIMPPIVVPRLTTKESFAFKYGRVEIRAKLPKGDWLVPLLLLEPLMESYGQTGYESGQLRVAMARGNDQLRLPHGKLVDGRTLYAGPVVTIEASQREDFLAHQRRSTHFSEDFHVYAMEWSSSKLRFSVDGQEYGELLSGFVDLDLNPSWRRGGPMAPFDRMFYITLGLSVGGFGDFIDRLRTTNYEKPWINKHPQARLQFWQSQEKWLPTWKQPKLLVDYVRVYAN